MSLRLAPPAFPVVSEQLARPAAERKPPPPPAPVTPTLPAEAFCPPGPCLSFSIFTDRRTSGTRLPLADFTCGRPWKDLPAHKPFLGWPLGRAPCFRRGPTALLPGAPPPAPLHSPNAWARVCQLWGRLRPSLSPSACGAMLGGQGGAAADGCLGLASALPLDSFLSHLAWGRCRVPSSFPEFGECGEPLARQQPAQCPPLPAEVRFQALT